MPSDYEFFDVIEIIKPNFAVFYHTKKDSYKQMHGELKYAFVISVEIKIEDKIKKLLPHQTKN